MSFVGEWDQHRARNLIGCLIKETGFSASQIARRSGLAPSTLTRIYPVPTVGYSLSEQSVAKLRATFPDAFSVCEADASPPQSPAPQMVLRDNPVVFGLPKQDNIPVYAAAVHFLDEGDLALPEQFELWEANLSRPVANTAVPFALGDAERYFVMYVPGEAMEPRFRAGERVLLDRIKPASINADVLVQLRDDLKRPLWVAGRLIARNRTVIELRQYREQATASIRHSQIKQIFPIIGMIDNDV